MVCSSVLVSLFSFCSYTQTISPLHSRTTNTPDDLVYDSKAWSFNAGAPVRSTVLVKNDLLYFGTAKGDFFAVNKKNEQVKWRFNTGYAIHSSATAGNGKIFFADNKQTVYALDENTGKLIWKFDMGTRLEYPWRFDYYYSSPVLYENKLIIGGDDGVPDYIPRKVAGYLLLDGCVIEGEAYSMNDGAEWEEIFTPGNPKKFNKIDIRPSVAMNATDATAAGADIDASMIMTTDAIYFGPKDGNIPGDSEIINVTIS